MYNTCNKVLLASLVMLFLVIGFSIKSFSQSKLVADETTITQLKASVKVETSNETVFKLLTESFTGEGYKYSVTIKRDRTGLYKCYTIPFKLVDADKVNQFFVKLNAKTK